MPLQPFSSRLTRMPGIKPQQVLRRRAHLQRPHVARHVIADRHRGAG